jgi:small-conductance mechanosensitive channel
MDFSLSGSLSSINDLLIWVPHWIIAPLILAAFILAALWIDRLALRVLRRLWSSWAPLRILVEQTRGPTRLALVILASRLATSVAPFGPETARIASAALNVAFIALLGWIAIRTAEIGATLYLSRFRIDVEDNLLARKHVTQVDVLKRTLKTLIVIITVAAALMTFPSVRQYGVSLFASAGAAGIVVGFAARPVLSNLIAGIQLAVTQPIRMEDAVIVENEWGWIEEITSTYVIVRLWDWRRMVVPLTYFIEKPFQNWTRQSASLIGSVMLYVDHTAPIDALRAKLEQIAREAKLWDGKVVNLQVTDSRESTIELRALVSARNAPETWDLRCFVRERLIAFLQQEHPYALPRHRQDISPAETKFASDAGTDRAASGGRVHPAPAST